MFAPILYSLPEKKRFFFQFFVSKKKINSPSPKSLTHLKGLITTAISQPPPQSTSAKIITRVKHTYKYNRTLYIRKTLLFLFYLVHRISKKFSSSKLSKNTYDWL